jgi:hypothetical protein
MVLLLALSVNLAGVAEARMSGKHPKAKKSTARKGSSARGQANARRKACRARRRARRGHSRTARRRPCRKGNKAKPIRTTLPVVAPLLLSAPVLSPIRILPPAAEPATLSYPTPLPTPEPSPAPATDPEPTPPAVIDPEPTPTVIDPGPTPAPGIDPGPTPTAGTDPEPTPGIDPQPAPGAEPPTTDMSTGLRLFAPLGIWNAPVGASTLLDASGTGRVGELASFVELQMSKGMYPSIAADSYSTPFYIAPAGAPVVPVKLDTGSWGIYLQGALNQGVPIPANAVPAMGTDGHLTVYQPSTDTLWELWRAVKQTDGWHASWGGAMRNVSSNPGYYLSGAWPGVPATEGWAWGATATSLPAIAGTATLAELRAGQVDHALAIAIPTPCRDYFSWPAQRRDGGSTSANCMPEGAHLRLDPNLDLNTLTMPRVTRILAVAAQRYGMVVRDSTNLAGSVSLYAEQSPPGTSAYTSVGGLFEGNASWSMLRTFPWRSMQLLPMTICQTGPCRP